MQLYESVRNNLERLGLKIEDHDDFFTIYQGIYVRNTRHIVRIDFEEKRNNFQIYVTLGVTSNNDFELTAKLSNADRNKLYEIANEYNRSYPLSKVYVDNFGIPMWMIDIPITPGFSASAEGLIQLLASLLKAIEEFFPKFIDAAE